MNTVRWNIVVSPDVEQSVRMFIVTQGGRRKVPSAQSYI